jgi:hypothetical protein
MEVLITGLMLLGLVLVTGLVVLGLRAVALVTSPMGAPDAYVTRINL